MRPTRVLSLLLTIVLLPVLAVGAQAAPTSAESVGTARLTGTDFVRHELRDWVWFGPRSWSGGGGPHGITILGGQRATIDLGAGGLICAPGTTWPESVNNYFRAKRQELQRGGWRITSTTRIFHPRPPSAYPPNYLRQRMNVRQGRLRGQAELDYGYVSGSSCIHRSLVKFARTRAWNRGLRRTINRVENSIIPKGIPWDQ